MALSRLQLPKWLDQQTSLQVDHPFTLSCILIFFTLFMVWLANRYRTKKLTNNLPPSPPKLPIIGNLHQLGSLFHYHIHILSEKYGPIMLLHLGSVPTLVVSSPDMAREIKATHEIVFANRPRTTAMNMLLYGCTNIVFSPYGEYWARLRKISAMELLSNRMVQSFRYIREEETALMIQKITCLSSAQSSVNLTQLLKTLTNDTICRCALGRKHGEEDGKMNRADLAVELVKMMSTLCVGDLFPRFGWIDKITGWTGRIKKLSKDVDMYLDQIIDEHIIQNNKDDPQYNQDFVDVLLQIQKNDINFTRQNIKALILDMFIGGTDSTYKTIEWTMAELLQNPNVMRKAQEEVRKVVGTNKKVEEDDIQKMKYLKLVVKESMRLHPVSGINIAESSKATNVKGFQVPAKTPIFLNYWSIQRNSKSWERPEEFIPERFTNNAVDSGGQDFNFAPFGLGRRICPGKSFALSVVEFTLANLLYWFGWKTVGGEKLDMSEAFTSTICLKMPVHLVAVPYFS
ncbi:hypothetical protein AQUCO_01200181v1 [Aquilegia coerulea]|uniref:Cytochrome P450 n=1 Tax=Aquilegia coerulea TaxID=218851 RepID=A0A2G5E4P4_AQUCA|nr:hypothetical protein AQUCO_01200181v1 [Aquilegia coerulea]